MKSMPAPVLQTSTESLGQFEQGERLPTCVEAIRESIACLAFKFFAERGHQHGHDLEDWLRAESETLLPIAIKTYDFEDTLIIRAEIPVLTSDDFEVSVEPRRIIITDKGRLDFSSNDDSERGNRLFHTIVLPDRVDWASAATAFKDGVLEVEIPKVQPGESLTTLD